VCATMSLGLWCAGCGAQVRWSTVKVKVMWVRADGPGAMKDEH
jgi:hypothetical protein